MIGSCMVVLRYYWWVCKEKCGVFKVFRFYGICVWLLKVGEWEVRNKIEKGKWRVLVWVGIWL